MRFTTIVWTCNESDPEVWTRYELKVPTPKIELIPFILIDAELAAVLDLGEPLEQNQPYRELNGIIPTILGAEFARVGWFKPYRGEPYVIAICEHQPSMDPFESRAV